MLQDQASGERCHDRWSSGLKCILKTKLVDFLISRASLHGHKCIRPLSLRAFFFPVCLMFLLFASVPIHQENMSVK